MADPSWMTPPRSAAHVRDPKAVDFHHQSLGVWRQVPHAHLIQEKWPHELKQAAAAHIDRHHGGKPLTA